MDFYTRVMGMTVLRRGEMPEERRRNASVGYGAEDETAVLELTAYQSRETYNAGDAFGHLAVGFADVVAVCAAISAAGGAVSRQPFVIASGRIIAFVTDPDGYAIELIQPAPAQ